MISCQSCHFDTQVALAQNRWYPPRPDGKPGGVPRKNFKLLVNYNGKVTTGTTISMLYKGAGDEVQKFYVIAPYYAHTIAKNAVTCVSCHANMGGTNAAMQEYKATGQITMTKLARFSSPSLLLRLVSDWA